MHDRSQRRLNAYRGRSRKNVLFQLGEGETPTVRALILYFDGGLFRDEADGEGWISETRTQVALNSGVPYSSAKRGIDRLKAKGILEWDTRKGWRFSYSRWLKMSQAIPIRELPEWDEPTHRADATPEGDPTAIGHEFLEEPREAPPEELPSAPETVEPVVVTQREQAMDLLLSAGLGVQRPGAWAAVGRAIIERRLSLPAIQNLIEAVRAIGKAAYRPGGLITKAIMQPRLGEKILRDHAALRRKPQETRSESRAPAMPPKATESRSDGLRRWFRSWETLLDVWEPDDRETLLRYGSAAGWTAAELQTIPELKRAMNS